jgi:predicted permease
MPTILGVAIPFFAVLLCGMLAARLRLLDARGLFGLNTFVFWFSLPALLFQKVAATPFERLTDPWLYIAYEGSVLLLYGLVFAVARLAAGLAVAPAAMCAFVAAWGNVGYMGVPLLIAAFGEARTLPSVLAVVLDNLFVQSLTILLLEASLEAHKGGLRNVGRAIARNPLIIAVVAGAAVAAAGWALPTPVTGFLSLIGAAAAPAALFALGATLHGPAMRGGLGLVGWLTGAKLLGLPLIAMVATALLPVPPDLVVPTIITAALPSAASVFVIAQRYGVLEGPVAAVVFASHLVGIVTLTLFLVLLPA